MKSNIKEYTPSEYQKAIFNYVNKGVGNLVIEAAAGSGKTWTLCKCIELLPEDSKILFAAFNTDITNELKERLRKVQNANVSTIHSLGFSILRKNLETALELSEHKYLTYIKNNLELLANDSDMNRRKMSRYIKNVNDFVNFGRLFLATSKYDMEEVRQRYGIECFSDEMEVALKVMEWGRENTDEIDFTDMIWIPNALFLPTKGTRYDFIFIDEAQDLSKAQREIILKFTKINTRIIAAGCSDQTIYSFNGADPDSFSEFKSLPNTSTLPLSISYRCADKIVEHALPFGKIEKNNNGIEGLIEHGSQLNDIEDGAMVLCRNNAPLMFAYASLVKNGRRCVFLGKNLEAELLMYVEPYGKMLLNPSLLSDGFFARIYDEMFDLAYEMMEEFGLSKKDALQSMVIKHRHDIIQTLEILSYGLFDTEELKEKIHKIFGEQESGIKDKHIRISTIHKSKGLEADNVYIACSSLMPSSSAKKPWELRQETCLMYVAYTRPKLKLSFLDESPFSDFMHGNSEISLSLAEIKVNALYKKDRKVKVTEENSKAIVSRAKPIVETKKTTTTTMKNILSSKKEKTLLDLGGNKNKKDKRRKITKPKF